MRSVLLDLPGAIARGTAGEEAPHSDAAIAWHYGDPLGEQRAAEIGAALFDLSHRDILTVTGADAATWLHSLTSQDFLSLAPGASSESLILSPQGHVEHHFAVTRHTGADQQETLYLDTEPGHGAALMKYLTSMQFWSAVEVAPTDLALLRVDGPRSDEVVTAAAAFALFVRGTSGADPAAVIGTGQGITLAVPRDRFAAAAAAALAAGARAAGSWAADALRIPARIPRLGVDTDDRTIPNETRWLAAAVHANKGCYRGQETVARVSNLGRPPRRLVVLNLDGSVDRLPATGDAVVTDAGRTVGRVGTVAYHHELGPIALALVKRSLPVDTPLTVDGVAALIDPDGYSDHADTAADAPPRSVIDRRALPDLRRR
ncbi:folate-binding protein [Nakamurella sp. A5-74]|uniref:Folate-binding protein n=1 Tax=Nakamurella sp. A5-74 TaxID=3158264 RepID=A0AAU8DLV0_9ACTN